MMTNDFGWQEVFLGRQTMQDLQEDCRRLYGA